MIFATKVRVCCDFRDKSACMLWRVCYVATKERVCCEFCDESAYFVVFATKMRVFCDFHDNNCVFGISASKFSVSPILVPTLAQSIESCQQKRWLPKALLFILLNLPSPLQWATAMAPPFNEIYSFYPLIIGACKLGALSQRPSLQIHFLAHRQIRHKTNFTSFVSGRF